MTTNVVGFQGTPVWTFGDRMRKVRREAGLTVEQFAARLGYPEKRVAAWESGRTTPRDVVAVAGQVRREFRVPEWWTLGLDNPTNRPGGEEIPTGKGFSREYVLFPNSNKVTALPPPLTDRFSIRAATAAA